MPDYERPYWPLMGAHSARRHLEKIMPLRSPSIKSLRQLFGANAAQAKALLLMSRNQLAKTPVGAARVAECYHAPTTQDIRMECLNALGGFHGVEGFTTRRGECLYLNAGDTYTPTLVRYGSSYRIGCWGDIAEQHGATA